MIRARGLSQRFGERTVLAQLDLELEAGGFLLVTGPERLREDDAAAARAPACRARAPASSRSRSTAAGIGFLAHEPLVYRELTAAREPRPVRPPLPRSRAPRAHRHAARALRPVGRARTSGPARSRAGCSSGSRSAGRFCTIPSCCSSTSRSTRSTRRAPSCSTASSPRSPGERTFLVATHDPARLAPLATGRLALAA